MTTTLKKPTDAFVFLTKDNTNEVVRTVSPADFQVGYSSLPAELQVTGRISNSIKTIEVKPGQTITYDNNVTFFCVNTVGTPNYNIAVPKVDVTILLPEDPRKGQVCHIKDTSGTASKYKLIVKSNKAKIDKNNSYTISSNFSSVSMVYDGLNWILMKSDSLVYATTTSGSIEVSGGIVGPAGPPDRKSVV